MNLLQFRAPFHFPPARCVQVLELAMPVSIPSTHRRLQNLKCVAMADQDHKCFRTFFSLLFLTPDDSCCSLRDGGHTLNTELLVEWIDRVLVPDSGVQIIRGGLHLKFAKETLTEVQHLHWRGYMHIQACLEGVVNEVGCLEGTFEWRGQDPDLYLLFGGGRV